MQVRMEEALTLVWICTTGTISHGRRDARHVKYRGIKDTSPLEKNFDCFIMIRDCSNEFTPDM